MNAPTRPVLRYHGGKWRLAPWIISHFPPHRTYVEPYGGAASVLLRKARVYAEVYNDLDEEVVNLFRVLRDVDQAAELIHRLELTPFSRADFEDAFAHFDEEESPVARAVRLVARSFMGFGSNAHAGRLRGHRSTGFRANTTRAGTTPATDWRSYPGNLPAIIERLRGVIIDRRPALQVMAKHDGPETLHYVDPPYMHGTRSAVRWGSELSHIYAHEMTDGEHQELLEFLRELDGMVVVSGYASDLYERALADWRRADMATMAAGARPRVETLWISPRASDALEAASLPLLYGGAE